MTEHWIISSLRFIQKKRSNLHEIVKNIETIKTDDCSELLRGAAIIDKINSCFWSNYDFLIAKSNQKNQSRNLILKTENRLKLKEKITSDLISSKRKQNSLNNSPKIADEGYDKKQAMWNINRGGCAENPNFSVMGRIRAHGPVKLWLVNIILHIY